MSIFTQEEEKADFLALDMSQLRACELSIAVPPPGLCMQEGEEIDLDNMGTLRCMVCNCVFPSRQSILLHFRTAHRIRKVSNLCTLSNSCCICNAIFKTRGGAAKHFHKTIERGHCNRPRTYNMQPLVLPPSFKCPVPECSMEHATFEAVQQHLAQVHFPWLLPKPSARSHHASAASCLHGGLWACDVAMPEGACSEDTAGC